MKKENTKFIIASILIFAVVVILSCEGITRLFGATIVYDYDSQLGWRPKKNFSGEIPVVDQSGDRYFVDFSTNDLGFREFGDISSKKKKILFIGDSWTGDPNTSDAEAYFGVVKDRLPVEVFAIGGGGYGSLQELLLLKEYAELIKPDIFVLQYCDNDLINNSYFLEGPSIVRNQKNIRPYIVDGKIKYRMSSSDWYVLLYRYSRLFRSVDGMLSSLQYRVYHGYYPQEFSAYDGSGPAGSGALQEKISAERAASIKLTEELMTEMKNSLLPGTKFLTFPASADDAKELGTWQTMALNAGFQVLPSVAAQVEKAEKEGAVVRVHDGAHWNRLGNKIAGEELVRILQRDYL